VPDENETVDEKERAERMKAWLASLPAAERAGFESVIVNTPRHTPEQIAAALQEALKQLPEEQRMAVFLCDFGGLSYVEASAQLHIPAAAVRQRVEAGRRRLELFLPRELMEDAKRLNSSEGHDVQE
jgi:DNA-directed RNA polymerase specialized sigma24 family protein